MNEADEAAKIKADMQPYDMSFKKMILASGASHYYFHPAEIKCERDTAFCKEPHYYISGDNIALSPAMYAYLHANEVLDPPKKLNEIRVVSIGNYNQLPEKIDTKTSIMEWVARLTTLNAPVKKHTMDYMVADFLAENGMDFFKFDMD